MRNQILQRIRDLLESESVARILAWKQGDFPNLTEPFVFTTLEQLENLVYDKFCAANLSKYLITLGEQEGTTLILLKPCDTYSFNQLVKERQIRREAVYIVGVSCNGNVALEELEEKGLLERCTVCDKNEHIVYDELICNGGKRQANNRFKEVLEVEAMGCDSRYNFWQKELRRCIRCNACRNACPSCHCKKCVFDNNKYEINQKANADSFEEQMFHIIRAYHVAGRCTDCGECCRVCPQKIKLNLLNRKFIKDINEFYGEFQAGANLASTNPLADFDAHRDGEVTHV